MPILLQDPLKNIFKFKKMKVWLWQKKVHCLVYKYSRCLCLSDENWFCDFISDLCQAIVLGVQMFYLVIFILSWLKYIQGEKIKAYTNYFLLNYALHFKKQKGTVAQDFCFNWDCGGFRLGPTDVLHPLLNLYTIP